jgi:hypothetical protein
MVRRQNHADACRFENPSELIRPLAVPVADQYPMARQEPVDRICGTPGRLDQFTAHYHRERNHQGLGNRLIVPASRGQVGARIRLR